MICDPPVYPAGIYPGAMPASLPSPAVPRSGEGGRPSIPHSVRRQREIATLTALAVGSTQVHGARLLGVSDRTMRRYLLSAVRSLGAATTTHAVALAASAGLLDPQRLKARTVPPWPPP